MKISFIHGRPSAHPTHVKYAESINAEFFYVDSKIRYHDLKKASPFRRYFSWLRNSLLFSKKKCDIYFSEEAYFPLGIMKWLYLVKGKRKIVALMGTHTLYFLAMNRYSFITTYMMKKLLKRYDAFICIGMLQKELLYSLLGRQPKMPIYCIYNGVEEARLKTLSTLRPELDSNNILFIGDIPNENRLWYKGFDIMLEAFSLIKKTYPNAMFTIVGDFDNKLIKGLLMQYSVDCRNSIFFVGKSTNIAAYLEKASLYLHCARGEAWGISIMEAMAAGIIPLVSDKTGAMEVVNKIDERLVCSLSSKEIAERIGWIFEMPLSEKKIVSEKSRMLILRDYTETKALKNFKNVFFEMYNNFNT